MHCMVLLLFFFGSFLRQGFCNVAQAGLEVKILLPQLPQYWDYRHDQPCPAVGGFKCFKRLY